jgi:hypothetical protein
MSLNLKGSHPNPRCQSKNIEMKYKTHIEFVHEMSSS